MQNIKTRQFERQLIGNGFVFERQKGSHSTYKNAKGITITIPATSTEINGCIVKRIIKQYGLV